MYFKPKIFSFLLALVFIGSTSYAADIYVDKIINQNITTGSYSPQNRDNSGTAGDAYTSVQAAINNMAPGDHIYLRGGTYQEGHINITSDKNPTNGNWTDNYNLLASYPGEWAILDGQNNLSNEDPNFCVIGNSGYYGATLKYWKFERLEIKNGRSANNERAAGFWGEIGPFWFKHCYIHDNYVTERIGSYNNAGLKGHAWQDSIVEYCWFEKNGALNTTNHNEGHIVVYSDYNYREICENGFNPSDNNGYHNMKNEYRYNYFDGSGGVPVAIKHKAKQFFTNHSTGEYSDIYNNYGDKIHHNIIYNHAATNSGAIIARQDFVQIYQNILDGCAGGIGIGENDTGRMYKACTWNNLIYEASEHGLWRIFVEQFGEYASQVYYGYDYNNIIYNGTDGWNWTEFTIYERDFETGEADYTNYVGTNNYSYGGDNSDIYKIADKTYTRGEYKSLYPSAELYANTYTSVNPLFMGSSGAAKYKTLSSHTIETGTNPGNAGANTSHPYLSGITIPDYIGPADPDKDSGADWNPANPDPDDGGWINYVLSLTNISTLRSGSNEGEMGNLPVLQLEIAEK